MILALFVFYALIKLPGYIKRKTMEKTVANEVAVIVPEGLNVSQIGEILEHAGLFSQNEFAKIEFIGRGRQKRRRVVRRVLNLFAPGTSTLEKD